MKKKTSLPFFGPKTKNPKPSNYGLWSKVEIGGSVYPDKEMYCQACGESHKIRRGKVIGCDFDR